MESNISILKLPRRVGCLAILCVAACSLSAQDTRSVRGIVCDQNHNPLTGAVVQIENTRTLWVRSYITQKDGRYRFFELDPDVDYRLRAIYHRVRSRAKTLSKFDGRLAAVINLPIELKEETYSGHRMQPGRNSLPPGSGMGV